MSVVNYPRRYDDSDLDDLSAEERARRLAIRAEIRAKLEPISETASERAFRERTAMIEAKKREPEIQASAQAQWDEAFDQRWDMKLAEQLPPECEDLAGVGGVALYEARKFTRAHVEQEVARAVAGVRKEMESGFAAMQERMRAATGKLPMVKFWAEGAVAYEGELISDGSNLYQALKMTGQQLGGSHWACVARGADIVASAPPNLPAPDFGDETNALRAELAAGFEKASGDLASLETRVTNVQAIDRERLIRIEDSVGRIRLEVREEAHAEFERALAEQERAFGPRLVASERRVEAFEAQALTLEAQLIELRLQARDKPAFDQDQVNGAVEAAVARTRAETRAELSVEYTRSLEAQRREFSVEFQALKERLGDVASRPRFDQSQIEHAAASAAESAVAQLRVGLDDVTEAHARAFDVRLADLEARVKGAAGKLPVAKAWTEGSITYEAQVVSCNDGTFQAVQDTAKTPGVGGDWVCLARSGRDGRDGVDGRSLRLLGAYHVDGKYERLDIVEFQGEVFIARRDGAGLCPGADWLRLTGPRGERGPQGERGPRGSRGERGPVDATLTIDAWTVDAERYRAIPKLSNGTVGAAIELRSLFALYQTQTSE